jgi:WhiB family redox-sensing transcriptional regulator
VSDIYIKESDINWMNKAACREMDISLFFPSDGMNLSKEVREVCNSCPVKVHCYIYAEKNYLDYGAFGGMSAKERHEKRKIQGRNSHKFKKIAS